MKLVSVFAALVVGVHAAEFRLHHRVSHPTHQSPWSEYGSLDFNDDHAQLQTAPPVAFPGLPDQDLDAALYQVALQASAGAVEVEWSVSSVKLCHLADARSQAMYLHVSTDDKPFALDHFVSPVPHDGSCPTPTFDPSTLHRRLSSLNTTVFVKRPSPPPVPQLRAPPPLTPEGKIIQPIPEKSFLQKYWIYIVGGLLALLLAGGPEEPAGGQK